MASSQPSRPDLKLTTSPVFPQHLFDELASSIKGPVLRPTDPDYPERAKTFNGKLKPRNLLLVSPFDAQDVSAVIKFCRKYDLSPSVRAGGFGIAGWSVAGDIIVDMSMMKDIGIEPPLSGAEGSNDWTPLKDVPLPAVKDSSLAQTSSDSVQSASVSAPSSERSDPHRGATKRRREDRTPSPGPDEVSSGTGIGQYDGASAAVASFLRGPPLPPVPGETPREPPTSRPRLHSPEPELDEGAIDRGGFSQAPSRPQHATTNAAATTHEAPPPLNENARQISSDSATSSDSSSRLSAFGSGTDERYSSDTTTPDNSGQSTSLTGDPHASGPFTNFSAAASLLSSTGFWQAPGSGGASTGFTAMGPMDMDRLMQLSSAAGAGGSGVVALNPSLAFSMSGGPAGSSQFAMPPMMSMSMPMPSMSGQPFPSGLGGLGISPAFAQALQGHQGALAQGTARARSRPLGTMHHSKPVHPHAYVTFGAGMRQKEIDTYTADHSLEGVNSMSGEREEGAVPYHVPMSAHPVGSAIMLLSGFGFISRLYGLSIDNLVEVEMVLADGRIVIVNADEDPDLWWAVRGAGPAFGIATRYKARAFPIPVVFAGNLIYRFHRATAPSLIKHFRDCIKAAPRELYANVLLTAGPADKDSLIVIQMCYVGPKAKGMEYLQAISSWDGERCLLNEVNEKSFLNQQDSIAQVLRGQAGRQWFIRSSLITTLPDEVINRTVLEFANTPIGCTWIFELAGGAIGDFEDNCLPKEQREATWTVAALHQWDMGIDDPRCITTAEGWMKETIGPASVGGPFPTFLGRHEPPSRTMACYGKNWARLAELKRKYDPDCFFKNNFWPLDKDGSPIAPLVNEPPSP